MKAPVIFTILLCALISLAATKNKPRVIYGEDNRVDLYKMPRADIREISDSTVALIPKNKILKGQNGSYKISTAEIFGEKKKLCTDEPFFNQPMAADCSGALVGDDLIATAAHCLDEANCDDYAVVFGYRMLSENSFPETINEENVYFCKKILASEYTSEAQDYALVQLDRQVLNHKVLQMEEQPAQINNEVYIVGHPSGLPTKIADGAKVRQQNGTYFKANLDAYGGNSGSAVFDSTTNKILGILVSGEMDFVYDNERKCTMSHKCSDNGCRGEDMTNISYIINAIKNSPR